MNEKIRFSEFFTRAWALFSGRYRALLTPILMTSLPLSILSGGLGIFSILYSTQIATPLHSGADVFIYSMLLIAASVLIMLVSFFVVIPAGYSMYIILLHPGISGMDALRQCFRNYGKSLGNMLFSCLPQYIAAIPITTVAVIVSVFIGFHAAYGNAMIAPIITGFIVMILGIILLLSVVYAYFAQMIPLSMKENVPITSTLVMAPRRAKGSIFSYVSLLLIYYVVMLTLFLGAGFLQTYSMESYLSIYMLLILGSAFLSPLIYAMNAASYQLCKERTKDIEPPADRF